MVQICYPLVVVQTCYPLINGTNLLFTSNGTNLLFTSNDTHLLFTCNGTHLYLMLQLRRAYFSAIEEVKALKEQIGLKDKRIRQLEDEMKILKPVKEAESDC